LYEKLRSSQWKMGKNQNSPEDVWWWKGVLSPLGNGRRKEDRFGVFQSSRAKRKKAEKRESRKRSSISILGEGGRGKTKRHQGKWGAENY